MKAAKITVLLIIFIVLINWIRQENFSGPLPTVLPLLGGRDPSIFDIGGAICVGIAIWGLFRLFRNRKQ